MPYLFEEGEEVNVGSHGEHELLFAEGEPVPDTGTSELVFENGTGLGGLDFLEDWEDPDFTWDRYGGDLDEADRVTDIVWQGDYSGRIGGPDADNNVGIWTTEVTLEAPVTLNCRFRVEPGGAAIMSYLAQDDNDNPESYQVSAEASDNTFEVEYQEGGSSFGGDSGGTDRQVDVEYSSSEWYRCEYGVDEDDEIFAVLFDEDGETIADISGEPDETVQSGGFGFGIGGGEGNTAYFDSLQVIE